MRLTLLIFPEAQIPAALLSCLDQLCPTYQKCAWDVPLADLAGSEAYLIISGLNNHETLVEQSAYTELLSFLKTETARGLPCLGLGQAAAWLLEQGFLPGLFLDRQPILCLPNHESCQDKPLKVRLSADYQWNAFSRRLKKDRVYPALVETERAALSIPTGLLAELEVQGLNLLLYCDEAGKLSRASNPAGSLHHIAALSNKAGNVLALFPTFTHDEDWAQLLLSLYEHLASGYVAQVEPLYYWPRGV